MEESTMQVITLLVERRVLTVCLVALLMALAPASAQTTIRPISDWVAQQGTFCWPDGSGGCVTFVPPIKNFGGFTSPDRCVSADYAGLADKWLKEVSAGSVSVGTTMEGTVIERKLKDGTVEVRVVLHTRNALTWVHPAVNYACDPATDPLLFGRRAPEVLAGGVPSLTDLSFDLVFLNTGPGAPLPDLMELFFVFGTPDLRQMQFLAIRAQGEGQLRAAFGVPDPTRGRVTVVQNGIFMASWKGALAAGYPVELIRLQPVGK